MSRTKKPTIEQSVRNIKENIRQWGNRVKDVSMLDLGYHILVNDKYKLKVILWGEDSGVIHNDCDVVAMVNRDGSRAYSGRDPKTKTFSEFNKSPKDLFTE